MLKRQKNRSQGELPCERWGMYCLRGASVAVTAPPAAGASGQLLLLYVLHKRVHVPEAGHDVGLSVFQLHAGKLHAVVPDLMLKHTVEEDGVDQLLPLQPIMAQRPSVTRSATSPSSTA